MPTYAYRCDRDGPVELRRPMGEAAAVEACPVCAGEAVRVVTAPRLSLAPRARVAAIDRAERTRSEPDVVTAPPPRPGSRRAAPPVHPATRRLPRP